tara:strand:- start:161 stop:367 length:207 start_codon:yes stop_codon:yes gene_type:complete
MPANQKSCFDGPPLGRAIRGSRGYHEHPEQDPPVCEKCWNESKNYFEKHNRYIKSKYPDFSYLLEWID